MTERERVMKEKKSMIRESQRQRKSVMKERKSMMRERERDNDEEK